MSTLTVVTDDGTETAIDLDAGDAGLVLSAVLGARGVPLNTRCGQRGLCHGCEVELLAGTAMVNGATTLAPALLRACRAVAAGDIRIHIPSRSRMEHRPQVGDTFRIDIPFAHQPLYTPEPGRRDTAFAIDIGTTTVVVQLLDLASGALLAKAGGFNGQIRHGDNVLTRIEAAAVPDVRRDMQSAVVAGTIVPLLEAACASAGISLSRLAGGTLAGNTTMLHLLLGEDPTPLGVAPFTARFLAHRRITAGEIGLDGSLPGLYAETPLDLLPGIAGYVGADIVAGIHATGMAYDEKPALLVDVGTNGEIVLQSGGKMFACATAAGPAFEGRGLRCGTRARDGAVGGIRMTAEPWSLTSDIVGDVAPGKADGICGSAYVDFLATGKQCGLLTAAGRFTDAAWLALPASTRVETDDERAIRVAGPEGAGAVVVSEVDVAVLLQAKAAIAAGIETLLTAAGIQAGDVGRVCLAGGFGMHLDIPNAIAMGLLPGFIASQIEVVGNTSLAGAVLAALDRSALDEMEEIRANTRVLELNLQPGFEDCYIDNLLLP